MLGFELTGKKRILFLGAHSDDIEIGCGGSILALSAQCELEVLWIVFGASGERIREAKASARSFLSKADSKRIDVLGFRNSYFPSQVEQIKEFFETLKPFRPDIVFTHYREDLHQDHKVICDLTWNTFRDHLILEYEVPKYDGDLGRPNVFVRLQESTARRKAKTLCRFFRTQGNKHWFSEDTFLAVARLRGIECASPSGFAEAFYCRKLVLGER